jgi:GNAT superfamily N-acetyltransferase
LSKFDAKPQFLKQLIQNEQEFHKLFSSFRNYSRVSLYYNKVFSDDPVFNHFVVDGEFLNDESVSEELIENTVEEIKNISSDIGFRTTVFSEQIYRKTSMFEKIATSQGYRITEQMEILSKKLESNNVLQANAAIEVTKTKDFEAWNDLFMRSFSIPISWKDELLKRGGQILTDSRATFLLAKEQGAELPQGCLLAFEVPKGLMGVYGVGTDQRWRGRGIARAMMAFVENHARDAGCQFMTLQTVTSDGVSPMYKKMGYSTEFDRNILWNPLSG